LVATRYFCADRRGEESFAALEHPYPQFRHLYPFKIKKEVKGMYNPPLEKLKVAAPCKAEWRWMYGNDRVRFCNQCQLYVYNLSALTREQAEDLILSTEGKLCVRFYRRQDGTILTRNCPQGLQAIKEKFTRTRTHVVAAVLTFLSYLGLLWWVKSPPPPPIMGSVARPVPQENIPPPGILPVVGEAVLDVPEMGKMIYLPVVKRSESYIRERATFKATPIFHSAATLQDPGSQAIVYVTISPEGNVTGAISMHSDPDIRQVVETAAYRWKFQPMKDQGIPATVESRLTFPFKR
jgi:hypothetical protein